MQGILSLGGHVPCSELTVRELDEFYNSVLGKQRTLIATILMTHCDTGSFPSGSERSTNIEKQPCPHSEPSPPPNYSDTKYHDLCGPASASDHGTCWGLELRPSGAREPRSDLSPGSETPAICLYIQVKEAPA